MRLALLLRAAQDLRGATDLKDRIQPGGQGPQEGLAAATVGPADRVLDRLEKAVHDIFGRRGVLGADLGSGHAEFPEGLDEFQQLLGAIESFTPVMFQEAAL